MSEYLLHSVNGEPYFPFRSNMGDLLVTKENSVVYRHPFENRGVDHIFLELGGGDQDDQVRGAFLFRGETELDKPGFFQGLIDEMNAEGWDFIECGEVSEGDQDVFDRFVGNHVIKVTNKKIRRWLDAGED